MRPALDCDALVVGLTLVPGLISRNKSFALFEQPEVRRARGRSALLRGIVRQLAGAYGGVEGLEIVSGAAGRELRYRLPGAHAERRAVLSELELACVSFLAARANLQGLQPTDDDRARIDAALRRLSEATPVPPGPPPLIGFPSMTTCLFCNIASKTAPAQIVFENERVVAFRDIRPMAPVHVLVVPKAHLSGIHDAKPNDGDTLGRLLLAARDVAEQLGLGAGGYRLVINQGPDAGQSVDHLHCHVLGGRSLAWPPG